MGRRKSPPESVLADSTNTDKAQQAKQCLPGKQEGVPAATRAPATFSRKNKVLSFVAFPSPAYRSLALICHRNIPNIL